MVSNQSSVVTSVSTRSTWATASVCSRSAAHLVGHDVHRSRSTGAATWVRKGEPSMSTSGWSGVPSWLCSSAAASAPPGVRRTRRRSTAHRRAGRDDQQQRSARGGPRRVGGRGWLTSADAQHGLDAHRQPGAGTHGAYPGDHPGHEGRPGPTSRAGWSRSPPRRRTAPPGERPGRAAVRRAPGSRPRPPRGPRAAPAPWHPAAGAARRRSGRPRSGARWPRPYPRVRRPCSGWCSSMISTLS